MDLNHRNPKVTDLQSARFNHLPTDPKFGDGYWRLLLVTLHGRFTQTGFTNASVPASSQVTPPQAQIMLPMYALRATHPDTNITLRFRHHRWTEID